MGRHKLHIIRVTTEEKLGSHEFFDLGIKNKLYRRLEGYGIISLFGGGIRDLLVDSFGSLTDYDVNGLFDFGGYYFRVKVGVLIGYSVEFSGDILYAEVLEWEEYDIDGFLDYYGFLRCYGDKFKDLTIGL